MPPKLNARDLFLWGVGLAAGHIVLQLVLTLFMRQLNFPWGYGVADALLTVVTVVLSGVVQVMLVLGAVMIGGALIVRAVGADSDTVRPAGPGDHG